MDPQTLNNLDPKLKETYERVMGAKPANSPASSSGTADDPGQQNNAQNAATEPENAGAQAQDTTQQDANNVPLSTTPDGSQPAPLQSNDDKDPQTQTVTISEPLPETNVLAQPAKSEHDGLLRVFYILGSTVFFLVYAFFWMRIFGLQFPGLSF